MFVNTVSNFQIYRFIDAKSNKIWGTFQTEDGSWIAFWGGWKMQASFKNHGTRWTGESSTRSAREGKIRKGYQVAELEAVQTAWPQFEDMMLDRFTWFKLQQLAAQV